jgi:hypothetical protein
MSGDDPLKFLKPFLFILVEGDEWVYWKRRHLGVGAVVHLETRVRTPWQAIVGW